MCLSDPFSDTGEERRTAFVTPPRGENKLDSCAIISDEHIKHCFVIIIMLGTDRDERLNHDLLLTCKLRSTLDDCGAVQAGSAAHRATHRKCFGLFN